MRFSTKLSLFLSFVTLALADVAQVKTDLNNIQAATTALGDAVQSWDGDAAFLTTISGNVNNLAKVTEAATSDIKASSAFSAADAQDLINLVGAGAPALQQAIGNLIAKAPQFKSVGASLTVENSLQTLLIDGGALSTALKANTPAELAPQVTNLQNQLSGILFGGIEVFAA